MIHAGVLRYEIELAGGSKFVAEGMTATKAAVLGPFASHLVDRNEMAHHHTLQRMTDHVDTFRLFNKRMSTAACVFRGFQSCSHYVDPMPEDPAAIVNSFVELAMSRIRIASQLEKQWVSAPLAYVLIVARPLSNREVMMRTKETGQSVSQS
ncbi:MAG TPA: hypothetical protein VIT88_01655 [Pyrinomonadaceae bacterium]